MGQERKGRFDVECASLFKNYRAALCLALEQERARASSFSRKYGSHSDPDFRNLAEEEAVRASELESLKNTIFFGPDNASELVSFYGDVMLSAAARGEVEAAAEMSAAADQSEVMRYARRASDMEEVRVRLSNIRETYSSLCVYFK
ncbi:hypothetical protein ACH5AU_30730 [Streptomyces albidoflavus]